MAESYSHLTINFPKFPLSLIIDLFPLGHVLTLKYFAVVFNDFPSNGIEAINGKSSID